jgi:hypothetical protein
MRKNNNQIRIVASHPALPILIKEASGSPGNSFLGHLMMILRKWQKRFRHPYMSEAEPTLTEIRSIEARVRKALYP